MKYSLIMTPTPCRVAESIISFRPTDSCARALTYLPTQNNDFGDWPVIYSFLTFSEWFVFRSTAFGKS